MFNEEDMSLVHLKTKHSHLYTTILGDTYKLNSKIFSKSYSSQELQPIQLPTLSSALLKHRNTGHEFDLFFPTVYPKQTSMEEEAFEGERTESIKALRWG